MNDSRGQLEEDIRDCCLSQDETIDMAYHWLDRQAAITRAECEAEQKSGTVNRGFREEIRNQKNRVTKLETEIAALQSECDKRKDRVMELWCSRHDMLNMCAYASCNYKTCPLVLKGVEKDGNVSEITS